MGVAGSHVKAVVFDIGATLVTGPPIAPNKVIAGLMDGIAATEVAPVIMTAPLESAEQVCEALKSRFGPLTAEAAQGVDELYRSQTVAAQPLDGARETVLELKRRGYTIGLLSDIWSPYYASVERALPEVVEAADAVVLSCRTGYRKPHLHNFVRVLSELRVEPAEALMVGDTYEHDILPALEVGMRAVWVLARPERETRWVIDVLNAKLPAPTATVASIAEVASLPMLSAPSPQPTTR